MTIVPSEIAAIQRDALEAAAEQVSRCVCTLDVDDDEECHCGCKAFSAIVRALMPKEG